MSGLECGRRGPLAKMDSAPRVPTSRSGLVTPLDFPECLTSRIDRSRHLLLVLQAPRLGRAALRPIAFLSAAHNVRRVVSLPADHELPRYAAIIGQSHRDQLGRLALEQT